MNIEFDVLHAFHVVLALLFLVLYLTKKGGQPTQEPSAPEPAEEPDTQLKETDPESALQLLALLQQDARFIDFVTEDLGSFSDADIGAAARVVHEGCVKVLTSYFSLSPIREEQEESPITLPEGFDAAEVRLTGNVVGQAPFKGTLIHRGWKINNVNLPKIVHGHNISIVSPAEVEL